MIDDHALLVRYQVMAANRRHFELLFFVTAAFVLAYTAMAPIAWAVGPIMMAGGLVIHRLLKRERACFAAMQSCWAAISGEPLAAGGAKFRPGAMAFIIGGFYGSGLAVLLWDVAHAPSHQQPAFRISIEQTKIAIAGALGHP